MLYKSVYILQNELTFQDVIKLALPEAPAEGPDGTKIQTMGQLIASYNFMYYKSTFLIVYKILQKEIYISFQPISMIVRSESP